MRNYLLLPFMVRRDRAADHLIPHLLRDLRALPLPSLVIRISRGARSSHYHCSSFLLALGDLWGQFNRLTITFLLSGDMSRRTSWGGWGRGILRLHHNGRWLGWYTLLDPLLCLYLLECESVPGVDRQKALDNLNCLDREEGRYLVVALQNLLIQKGRLILLKR